MRKVNSVRLLAFGVASAVLFGCGGAGSALVTFAVKTLAGLGINGLVNGPVENARFNNPVNTIYALDGRIFVADFDNNAIRVITGGVVSTLFGGGNFNRPFGMALVGNKLYVQTDGNDRGERNGNTGTIWEIDTGTGSGQVLARDLGRPRGLCALPDGRIVMSNLTRNIVQLFDPANPSQITTIAGQDGVAGFQNGNGTLAKFDRPYGVCRMPDGALLVADQNNHRIRRFTLTGAVTTFAGTGTAGYADGPVGTAQFNGPQDVAATPSGAVYVGDNGNYRFRRITVSEGVKSAAGTGVAGFADGNANQCQFFGMEGFDISADGTVLIVADGNGGDDTKPFNRVRSIEF